MSTHIDLADDFGDFDMDCLDVDMLDGLLTDNLDTPPAQAKSASHVAQSTVGPAQPRYTHGAKHCQLTIDSLFGKSSGTTTQQREPPPQKRPVGVIDGAMALNQPPAKAIRLDEPRAKWSTDPIDIDSDYGDILDSLMDDDLLDDCTWQDPGPSTKVAPKPPPYQHRQPPPMFQARGLVAKGHGDNALVEATHAMDRDAMETYLYPLLGGQPARAYQQGAIQRCLVQNTLVALPTGMGKTLIAVVVMANYARWFPDSLSVFLAPTKPLVAQQMQACKGMIHAILSKARERGQSAQQLPLKDNWIVEMNGNTPPKSRQALWNSARFVFSTPQILQNDLRLGTLDGDNARRIALLVIDEAHRATGKYAYGESVSALYSIFHGGETPVSNPIQPSRAGPFRIMALTATPGSNMDSVKEIVQRLHVAHIFMRTEESLDVVPYMHGRRVEEVLVELPPWLVAARDRLADVITRSLNILCNVCHAMTNPGNPRNISGFRIRMDRDRYMMRRQGIGDSGVGQERIMGEFSVVMALAHIMQLLSEHGLRPAWTAIRLWSIEVARKKQRLGSASSAKVDCVDSNEWAALLRDFGPLIDALDSRNSSVPSPSKAASNLAARVLAPTSDKPRTDIVSSFFNMDSRKSSSSGPAAAGGSPGSIVDIAHKGFLGHPKLERMVEIVKSHFDAQPAGGREMSTRIIIFSQYRGSVSEIVKVLDSMQPLVKCEPFIGQSKTAGLKPLAASSSFSRGRRGGGGFRGRGGFRGGGGGNFRGGGNFYRRGGGTVGPSTVGHSGDTDMDGVDIDSEMLGFLDGDGDDSAGRGQTQKEQLAVLARFRRGETNIIVATCVGEEGLDIGEVDLIINYDAPASPIRLLQRIGRTGRARRGKVVVFLAKDTREEDSYKKAQREYKSVQAKIASGKNLMLRDDLSPPMLPPSLPPGTPVRTEIHLNKDDIASADLVVSVAKGSKSHVATTAGARARGGDRKPWTCEGIDAGDMAGFRELSLKYLSGSESRAAGSSHGARPEQQMVARLLERGVAWQASNSPQFRVSHSNRSSMYCRVMAGIEGARFEQDLDASGNAGGAHASLFRLPGQRSPKAVGQPGARKATAASKPAVMSFAELPAAVSPRKKARPAVLAASPRALEDSSGDDLDDVSDILARPPATKAAKAGPGPVATGHGETMDDTICIDSSPLMEDHGFHWSPRRESRNGAMGVVDSPTAASRIAMSPAFVKKAGVPKKSPASTGAPQSNGGRAHQRRSSLQRNLFDAIDDLVKSGKAKPAFDWSMALDTVLLNEAKAKGVDLGLSRAAGAGDDVPVRSTLPPTRPSFFSGIGEPGAFDRLYDEASVRAEPSRHMSLAGGLAVPATETAFQSAEQVLCSGSDCEGSIDADILGEVDNLSLLALDDLEYLTPPITAVPETPPMMLMDKDEGVTMSRASPPLPPPQFVAQTQVVCIDDDDTDAQLLAFDLDSDELFELSDVGIDQSQELRSTEHNRTTSTLLSPPCVQLARSPAFQQDASMPPSSSPLRPRKRAPISAGRSKIEDVDATPPLPSSSPVQRQGGRLVRGKLAGRSASATCVEPMSTPPREKPNKPKLRRPPAKRAFNPFIDSEAEVGDSDDEGQGRRLRVARAEEDDDEDGSEDLDENLSSFIVEDDHIEFETPGRQGHASDGFSLGQSDVTPCRIGDVYRRSLANETTPVSEIMRRLAEREKRRRWVSDSPTRNAQWAGANSLSLAGSGLGQDGAAGMLTSDVEEDDHSGSSDFEHAEDLFTQAA